MGGVFVIIPAFNEGDRIARTVAAARTIPSVCAVVVVDDGSADDTASAAERAGATALRHAANRGKAAAMQTGAAHISASDALLLFLDGDLGDTAGEGAKLVEPVQRGDADMTIGTFPPRPGFKSGSLGFVVRLARWGVRAATRQTVTTPLSGQRCLAAAAFVAALPLAPGFGVEIALTIDVLRAGYRVREVPTAMTHRVTGNDAASRLHRARQGRDVLLALLPRLLKGRAAAHNQ